ncbi:hypothetical protein OV079_20950 [Nannocystis pusilla]|uniref:Uncharacterized protein n=1 Tax=Nannocystis pusilla TaxID=889268 RepID=A0A9X3IYV3_9BACT|nr:hypothetical protein [Nannocystis pusilla]MCY1007979.1 hypothetical protein [Nannocystis pusilla]
MRSSSRRANSRGGAEALQLTSPASLHVGCPSGAGARSGAGGHTCGSGRSTGCVAASLYGHTSTPAASQAARSSSARSCG